MSHGGTSQRQQGKATPRYGELEALGGPGGVVRGEARRDEGGGGGEVWK